MEHVSVHKRRWLEGHLVLGSDVKFPYPYIDPENDADAGTYILVKATDDAINHVMNLGKD
jgi:hypothetical protein